VHRDRPVRAVITIAIRLERGRPFVRADQRLTAASGEFSVPARQTLIEQRGTLAREYQAHKLSTTEYFQRADALIGRLNAFSKGWCASRSCKAASMSRSAAILESFTSVVYANRRWRCSCAAGAGRCSHVRALWLVVARDGP
jgi:hypothetical protein